MDLNLTKLCRLCLQYNECKIQYTSIYKLDVKDSVEINKKIRKVLPSLDISDTQTKQYICQNCLVMLRHFITFTVTCEQNEIKFKGIVKRLQLKQEATDKLLAASSTVTSQPESNAPSVMGLKKPVKTKKTKALRPIHTKVKSVCNKPIAETIKTPKIIAVYSLQTDSILENPITDTPIETIKIEDDIVMETPDESDTMEETLPPPDDSIIVEEAKPSTDNSDTVEQAAPSPDDSDTLKRALPDTDIESPQPKQIKKEKEIDSSMPEIFKIIIWKALETRIAITTSRLQAMIGEKFKVWPCMTEIEKVIRSLHYIVSREPEMTQIKNSRPVLEARVKYALDYSKYNENHFIFVHEVGIRLAMRKPFNSISIKEFRAVAAMSRHDIIYFRLTEQTYNLDNYGNWIDDLLPILELNNLDEAVLVIENCPPYKVEKNLISHGHRILYLPPYSPFLNPLENIFLKWQRDIKSLECLSEEDLIVNMKENSKLINTIDCEIVYDKMKCCLSRCIKQQHIKII